MITEIILTQFNRPKTKMKPTSVTVHNTANPDSTARNNRDYFNNHEKAKASAQYVVDDKEIIRCIPEDEVAWHAGPANIKSIGIEVCEFTDKERQRKANENAAWLVADILKRYGWGIDKVKTHKDWTGKDCPRKLLPMWSEFLTMIQKHLDPLAADLAKIGVTSPGYWLENAVKGKFCKGDLVAALIQKMAAKIK